MSKRVLIHGAMTKEQAKSGMLRALNAIADARTKLQKNRLEREYQMFLGVWLAFAADERK